MTSIIQNICFDAHDPYAQAAWWDQVLRDYTLGEEDEPGDDECGVRGPNGQEVLFLKVPEGKTVKNRVHLCLADGEGDRDAEVARLLGLGATIFDDRRTPDGRGWAVLADPEGNEFCVLRTQRPGTPDAERVTD